MNAGRRCGRQASEGAPSRTCGRVRWTGYDTVPLTDSRTRFPRLRDCGRAAEKGNASCAAATKGSWSPLHGPGLPETRGADRSVGSSVVAGEEMGRGAIEARRKRLAGTSEVEISDEMAVCGKSGGGVAVRSGLPTTRGVAIDGGRGRRVVCRMSRAARHEMS